MGTAAAAGVTAGAYSLLRQEDVEPAAEALRVELCVRQLSTRTLEVMEVRDSVQLARVAKNVVRRLTGEAVPAAVADQDLDPVVGATAWRGLAMSLKLVQARAKESNKERKAEVAAGGREGRWGGRVFRSKRRARGRVRERAGRRTRPRTPPPPPPRTLPAHSRVAVPRVRPRERRQRRLRLGRAALELQQASEVEGQRRTGDTRGGGGGGGRRAGRRGAAGACASALSG